VTQGLAVSCFSPVLYKAGWPGEGRGLPGEGMKDGTGGGGDGEAFDSVLLALEVIDFACWTIV